MTEDEQTTLMIRGVISELPAAHREACDDLAEQFRRMIQVAGPEVGMLAFALVGAEMQEGSWQLLVRQPGKTGSFVVLAHPSDKSDFQERLIKFHQEQAIHENLAGKVSR
jgi:hypothetical protein